MKRLEKSALPRRRPMGGMSRSLTNEATTRPKAAPMTTPTASSTTLPRMMNSLNSFSMAASLNFWSALVRLVGLPPEKRRNVQVFLGGLTVTFGADVGGHAAAPILGGGDAGTGRPGQVHHLARRLARLLALGESGGDHGDP